MVGGAVGETVSSIDTTDPNLVSYFNFSEGVNPTSGALSWTNLLTKGDGEFGIVQADHYMYTTNAGNASMSTKNFTVSFDVRNFSAGDLLSITSKADGGNWRSVKLTSTSDSPNLSLTFIGDGRSVSSTLTSGTTASQWTTVTLVGSDSITENLKLYINGGLVGSLDMTGATNWLSENIQGIQFGNRFGALGSPIASAEIDNILVYNKALSAAEVKALVVPEPAATALSLLALAGLVAKRRRK